LTQADVLAPPPLQRPARSEPHDLFFYESPPEIGERPDRGENEGKVFAEEIDFKSIPSHSPARASAPVFFIRTV
jgi:hypothetical protein